MHMCISINVTFIRCCFCYPLQSALWAKERKGTALAKHHLASVAAVAKRHNQRVTAAAVRRAAAAARVRNSARRHSLYRAAAAGRRALFLSAISSQVRYALCLHLFTLIYISLS